MRITIVCEDGTDIMAAHLALLLRDQHYPVLSVTIRNDAGDLVGYAL